MPNASVSIGLGLMIFMGFSGVAVAVKHQHNVPSLTFMLEGTLEVTLKDGQVKRLQAGDALAEVVNTPHNGRNVGVTPVKLVVFYAGTADQALTRKEPLTLNLRISQD
jgi:quercetin dioxygenase-like cupin family protein